MDLFDTHAHLADEQLAADCRRRGRAGRRRGRDAAFWPSARPPRRSRDCLAASPAASPASASSAGIHPNHAAEAQPGDWDEIVRLSGEARGRRARRNGARPVLEGHAARRAAGLFRPAHPPVAGNRACRSSIHLRETAAEILAMLREARRAAPLRGVMHSFTGTAEQAAEFLDLGLHISFAGMVTYKKSDDLRAVAADDSRRSDARRDRFALPLPRALPRQAAQRAGPRRPHGASVWPRFAACPLDELARQTTANAALRRLLSKPARKRRTMRPFTRLRSAARIRATLDFGL